jgi:hypothetical protein
MNILNSVSKAVFKKAYSLARKYTSCNGVSSITPLYEIGYTQDQAIELLFPVAKGNIGFDAVVVGGLDNYKIKNKSLQFYNSSIPLFNY